MTLQSSKDGIPVSEHFTLTSLVPIGSNAVVVSYNMSSPDLNKIKKIRGLAALRNSTFVSVTAAMIKDMASNEVVPVPTDDALGAVEYQPLLHRFITILFKSLHH